MEKRASPKKFLNFLPRAASLVNFQFDPFSPGRDMKSDNTHKFKGSHGGKRFSEPKILIIPPDEAAGRKPKNGRFETQDEPTSPKISCMGQIKHNNKKTNKAEHASPPQETKPVSSPAKVKKQGSTFKKLFDKAKPKKKSDASNEDKNKPSEFPNRTPSVSQMKNFASSRDSGLKNFDWTAQISRVESDHQEEQKDGDQERKESLPIMVGGGAVLQPRKEVNLWKRRNMNPPNTLQLRAI